MELTIKTSNLIRTSFEGYELAPVDHTILSKLATPIPEDEPKRLEILRQSMLLDSNQSDSSFDRFTSLATRLFNVITYYYSSTFF
jgi:hypothetical protein